MVKIKSEYIKLSQFLKYIGIIETGGQLKQILSEVNITVNGEKENRKGRKLYPGDEIVVDGKRFEIE
ncbi:MAG: S4 domain-containing protein YaaA [Solobacterium sp.]|nr:S4 domain-containing protein YaaA [Solobacterium sp.]